MDKLRNALRRFDIMLLIWACSHYLMVRLWHWTDPNITGDVQYYSTSLHNMQYNGIAKTLIEYPTPVVWIFQALGDIGLNKPGILMTLIPLLMVFMDVAFTVALFTSEAPHREIATYFWIASTVLMGPLMFFRFDMLPTALVGLSLLWMRRYPRISAGLLGLGAAVKLWPALLFIPVLSIKNRRSKRIIWFCTVGFGLALLSLIFGGMDRLFSPLTWQKDRGLQVESVGATATMFARTFLSGSWKVEYTRFNAFEIFGPGVTTSLAVVSVATVASFALMGWLCWRLWRSVPSDAAILMTSLSIIVILIVTNKTLSPQYLIWLAAPLAVLFATSWPKKTSQDLLFYRHMMVAMLIMLALTQVIYPTTYWYIVWTPHGTPATTLALTLRNLLLALATVLVTGETVRRTQVRAVSATTDEDPS